MNDLTNDLMADMLRCAHDDYKAERLVREQLAEVLRYFKKGHRSGCACNACDALAAPDALDEAAARP